MKKFLLALIIIACCSQVGYAQTDLKKIARKGWIMYVYRVPADTAEKYMKSGIRTVDHYLNTAPYTSYRMDSLKYEDLGPGNYLLVWVRDNLLEVEYHSGSTIEPYVVNDLHRAQISLRDSMGSMIRDAKVWVDGKAATFIPAAGTFQVKQKKPVNSLVKIVVGADTSFHRMRIEEEARYTPFQQRWIRFRSGKAGRVVTWLPYKVISMVKSKPRYWFRGNKRSKVSNKGYMIFNKPKYMPGDTVRFKAWVLDKKGKQLRKDLDAQLEYYDRGVMISKKLATLSAETPGAYVYDFIVADSLTNDTQYSLILGRKKKTFLTGRFRVEDYLLDEVSSYNLKSVKDDYYRNDTLEFNASAKDANGLPLMDGRVSFYLITSSIKTFYRDREFIPDTLWKEEKTLEIEGDTRFRVPGSSLPPADLDLKAVAIFRNSNNETEEETYRVSYFSPATSIAAKIDNGIISADFLENGKSIDKEGWYSRDEKDAVRIRFPFRDSIDPMTDYYEFYTIDEKGKTKEFIQLDVPGNYQVNFSRRQSGDTVSFDLYNPARVPVFYTIFDRNKELVKASSSEELISWSGKIPVGKLYTLKFQYYWKGKEEFQVLQIGLLSKLMSTEISGASTIYPGQKDTINLTVKDYRNRVVPAVNLTAVSYNSQFASAINVPEPPYIQRWRGKRPIEYSSYELEHAEAKRSFLLGNHQGWRKPFNLDTMPYYQFLFPAKEYHLVKTRIESILPQLSVLAVKKGVPQEIHLLYINRKLVYYNGVTEKGAYAYSSFPGYVQIGIRFKDEYIEMDSLYLQPFYKHDVVYDLDSVSTKAKRFKKTDYWTNEEKDLLDQKILRLDNFQQYSYNFGYVWQEDRVVPLTNYAQHIAGPFEQDSIQLYKPHGFDQKFYFEPGYRYRVSPGMVRLEKIPFIPYAHKVYLPEKATNWVIGDTIVHPPVINYTKPQVHAALTPNTNYYSMNNTGHRVLLKLPTDSVIAYTILHQGDTTRPYKVLYGHASYGISVEPGNYTAVMVTRHLNFIQVNDIVVDKPGTYCAKMKDGPYQSSNGFVDLLFHYQEKVREERRRMQQPVVPENYEQNSQVPKMPLPAGSGMIRGKVIDDKGGDVVPGAVVQVKGYAMMMVVDAGGNFTISSIAAGKYVLQFTAVGYSTQEREVEITQGSLHTLNVSLTAMDFSLSEVIVTGYGVSRKKSEMSFSTSKISADELTTSLSGRVAGLNVTTHSNTGITLRGIRSLTSNNLPVYVVDGVLMDEMPAISPDEIASVTPMSGTMAISLYGERAANGVIIIITKGFDPKTLRENFRDYAIWQPNLITDKNGEVSFVVQYPDNITSWQTFVVGMDKKRRITKAVSRVKSFKPILAQLSGPQFLVEGDQANFVGKKVNYSTNPVTVDVNFSINDSTRITTSETLQPNSSSISELNVIAVNLDTIKTKFTIKSTVGFADGEARPIPVLRKGTIETIGNFYSMEKDTTIQYNSKPGAGRITLYAQQNTLDLLLNEIDFLKSYPYFCMEQTASKLRGLAMEKRIREKLSQPFRNQKEMSRLITKLQKGQLFEGGWSWWETGWENLEITNYVTRAFLELRGDASIEHTLRNALLYLHNRLGSMNRSQFIESLFTLSEAGHEMDYNMYLRLLPFDSLTVHQQWQIVSIKQQRKLPFDQDLQKLMRVKKESATGGLHWGDEGTWWNRNQMATTVIAYKTLEREKRFERETEQITRYFLEKRKGGRWMNTVESANVLAAILPKKLQQNEKFMQPAVLQVNGDTSFTVSNFPYTLTIDRPLQQPIQFSKSGGGLVYLSAHQQVFNNAPTRVDSISSISTSFGSNNEKVAVLKAGEKVMMKVEIDVIKEAEYIQIEIPVPAGCTFASKPNNDRHQHREYFRDRVVIFTEFLKKGKHVYEIELEPRYSGRYTINAAKIELMYFPVFYGRNETGTISIQK